MKSDNLPLVLPPGLNYDVSRYMAKLSWWNGNLVRWTDKGVLQPIGGWQKLYDINESTYAIREMFSWSDNSSISYLALGTFDKAVIRDNSTGTRYDVTPSDLVTTPSGAVGFGSGSFGSGRFGLDSSNNSGGGSNSRFNYGYWTFDNFGENLIAVHSNDGRLLQWLPDTPTTDLATVTNAPIGNRLCITTDERHVMVMGGTGSPRRVKWCSREDITIWTAASDNSAGGWELDTSGEIIAAIKVPQGILIATDIDIHLIEYIGPPDYYSRRLITDETGVVSPKSLTPIPNGAMLAGPNGFWKFNGGLIKVPCSLSKFVFEQGNLNTPEACFMGINEMMQEVWFFFPGLGEIEASRFVNFKYSDNAQWWGKGLLNRTCWHNPVWNIRPIAANDLSVYEHERGWSDDGSSRNVYAETGAFEIGTGIKNMAVSKVFHDTILSDEYVSGDPLPYEIEFLLARAPQGAERVYGPVELNVDAGYTTVRFKARQVAMKVTETVSGNWGLGITRLTAKEVGGGR